MIRDANFADIPGIVDLLHEGYRRSHYARDGRAEIDVKEAKRMLFQSVQRHGGQHGGSTWVQVAESDGKVRGFILGNLQRVYGIGTKLMATDLYWLTGFGCPPGDAFRLMRNMVEWAGANPEVIETRCGTTTAIMEDPEDAGVALQRLGFSLYGRIWRKEN